MTPNAPAPNPPAPSAAEQDRRKWNVRYRDAGAAAPPQRPEPHPLAVRWRAGFIGGAMLDAACGLGCGLAGAVDGFAPVYAVDVSEVAIAAARKLWPQPHIRWIVGDVTALRWPEDRFGLVCSLRFTDVPFLRRMRACIRPGGMILFEGFSRRQLETKPGMNPAWTTAPAELADVFAGWELLELGESDMPHALVRCAAIRPART